MTTFRGPAAETEEGIGALTLGGLLIEAAERHLEREALCFHEPDGSLIRWGYGRLEEEARRVARGLLAGGLAKGSRVALLMGNRPEWVAVAFGVALAGGVLVPLNTWFEPPELDYVLGHCDASVLLLQSRLLGHGYLEQLTGLCPDLEGGEPGRLRAARWPWLRRVVCLGLHQQQGAAEPWETFLAAGRAVREDLVHSAAVAVAPSDDAVVIYTSGTTARPKGVLHSHRPPALQSWRFARLFGLDPDVRVWSAFPFFWTAGFAMVVGATVAAGGCLVLEEHFEPGEALGLLEAERVTTPYAWPHQTAQMEDHPDWSARDLSSLRHVDAFGPFGRHPSVHVRDAWSSRAAYGLTETFTIVSSLPADAPQTEREASQGPILPGNAIRILDPETGERQPADAEGEIAVKGPTLMRGYLKTAPEECFDEDGFFHSGDAGFVDGEGNLHWTGRTSDLIKTGGANVSPVEIEEALLRHPGLKVAMAVGVPHATLGQEVVVCAVAHDGADVGEDDVRGFLRGRLAAYKIPRRVLFVGEEQLSLTANAKVRADALRLLAAGRLGESQAR